MRRRIASEFLDDPRIPLDEHAAALSFLRTINRRLGGTKSLLDHLRRWSGAWPRDRPVTLLDVGTGSADVPAAAADWARAARFDLRITAVDNHAGALGIARGLIGSRAIELAQVNALDLGRAFAPGAFDYVHAGLLVHHFDDESAVRVLSGMNLAARVGVVWNDLIRSVRGVAATRLFTLLAPRCARHDAVASVRAGFTRDEAASLAWRAGLDYCRYAQNFNTQRFTVAGEKCAGWAECATRAPGAVVNA